MAKKSEKKDERVFPRMPGCTAGMLRADIVAARAEWIAAAMGDRAERRRRIKSDFLVDRNKAGEVFDFHAFRHAYMSTIVSSGVSVKVAQELARHSSPTLTIGRDTHVQSHDTQVVLDSLPQAESAQNVA